MNFLQNNTIQKFLKNDATTLVLRLALLYLLWFLCRIVFYLQNAADIGTLTWSEIPELLHGAWMFDTASILYINALFILLSLFRPLSKYPGLIACIYLILYSIVRICVESIRIDSVLNISGVPVAQIVSIILLVTACFMIAFILLRKKSY